MKLCSRLLIFFGDIYAKNVKFGYLNPILELGLTHDLLWWLVGKPMVDFLFVLIELFSLSITIPELWGEMCTAQLFSQGVDLLALKFYLDRGSSPSTILDVRKLETLLLFVTVKHLSAYPLFDTIPECYGRTDRQTDGFAVAYTALANLCFAERCNKNVNQRKDVADSRNASEMVSFTGLLFSVHTASPMFVSLCAVLWVPLWTCAQVTWAQTTHVGCGYAQCATIANTGNPPHYPDWGGEYMVCNYGPWSV